MELDARTNQLASRCIAFEEKLVRENIDTLAADSELANKKLAEMNSELAKAQEHAKRFHEGSASC